VRLKKIEHRLIGSILSGLCAGLLLAHEALNAGAQTISRTPADASSEGIANANRIKVLKRSVTNPTDQARPHDNIVLNVADLKRIAPDFRAGQVIVTTSDAASLEEDARTLQSIELPSQADVWIIPTAKCVLPPSAAYCPKTFASCCLV
jgi:hypothetical protein